MLVMTFGFTNAPASFQHLMNHVFNPHQNNFLVVYLDDILIFSNTREEYIQHIRWVLEQLCTHQLYAKMKKCEWRKTEINYLGHIISQGQVAPEPQKIRAVKEWPIPTTVKEVQAFLGLANYYRRFVYRFSHIAHPLTELTKKEKSWL
jgi:hypothetical protein